MQEDHKVMGLIVLSTDEFLSAFSAIFTLKLWPIIIAVYTPFELYMVDYNDFQLSDFHTAIDRNDIAATAKQKMQLIEWMMIIWTTTPRFFQADAFVPSRRASSRARGVARCCVPINSSRSKRWRCCKWNTWSNRSNCPCWIWTLSSRRKRWVAVKSHLIFWRC